MMQLESFVTQIAKTVWEIVSALQRGETVPALGLRRSARLPVAAAIHNELQRPILLLTDRTDHAMMLLEELAMWSPGAAHLLFPEPMRGANVREYYYGAMRPIWWLAALTVALATLFRPLIIGTNLWSLENATSFVFFFGFMVLAVARRSILHAIIVPGFLLLLLLDILQWSFVIGAG
jgi:hypothetical protein